MRKVVLRDAHPERLFGTRDENLLYLENRLEGDERRRADGRREGTQVQ